VLHINIFFITILRLPLSYFSFVSTFMLLLVSSWFPHFKYAFIRFLSLKRYYNHNETTILKGSTAQTKEACPHMELWFTGWLSICQVRSGSGSTSMDSYVTCDLVTFSDAFTLHRHISHHFLSTLDISSFFSVPAEYWQTYSLQGGKQFLYEQLSVTLWSHSALRYRSVCNLRWTWLQ